MTDRLIQPDGVLEPENSASVPQLEEQEEAKEGKIIANYELAIH